MFPFIKNHRLALTLKIYVELKNSVAQKIWQKQDCIPILKRHEPFSEGHSILRSIKLNPS